MGVYLGRERRDRSLKDPPSPGVYGSLFNMVIRSAVLCLSE